MTSLLSYNDLVMLDTFEERADYLKLDSEITKRTFGGLRHLNQQFYRSREWRSVRNFVVARDNGNDLGVDGYPVYSPIIMVHHMNPITPEILVHSVELALDPDYLITVSLDTHNYIHFGKRLPNYKLTERHIGDTKLW